MSNAHYSDAAVAKLRAIVATIEKQITDAAPAPALQAAWTELVSVLDLGTATPTRECPRCKGVGFAAASRCSNCWSALTPIKTETDV